MKSYSSQSLAIVLALLIVGSIIGFALYARLIRESSRIVDEKSSSEANELVESVIGLINTVSYEKVKGDEVLESLGCDENTLYNDGCRKNEIDIAELEDIFHLMDLEAVDFSPFTQDFDSEFCLAELGINILSTEGVVIEHDDVYSIFVNEVNWDPGFCEKLIFQMEELDGSTEGFVMSTFYGVHDEGDILTSYKPYEFDDILGFKYGDVDDNENWLSYSSSSLSFPEVYPEKKDLEAINYKLDEVRFKSLGGPSKLTWSSVGSCTIKEHLLVEIGSTCGGKYIGKSFILPEEYFAPPIFDYVYFQGQGGLN